MREFKVLYESFRHSKPSPLTPLEYQYVDFAYWQRAILTGRHLWSELGYWHDKLGGELNAYNLPLREQGALAPSQLEVFEEIFEIDPSILSNLAEFSRLHNISLTVTALSAYKVLLHQLFNPQARVVVFSSFAKRVFPEIENLIGFFASGLPLATTLNGNPNSTEIFHRVRSTLIEAMDHQILPSAIIYQHFYKDNFLQSANPFRIPIFRLYEEWNQHLSISSLAFEEVDLPPSGKVSKEPDFFTFNLLHDSQRLTAMLKYDSSYFALADIRLALKSYERILALLLKEPTRRLSEIAASTSVAQLAQRIE